MTAQLKGLALLNACDDAALCIKFCHNITHQVCGGKSVVRDTGSAKIWSVVQWDSVVAAVEGFFREACRQAFTEDKAKDYLTGAGVTGKLAACVLEVYAARRSALNTEMISRTASIGCGRLADFDWRVNCTLASDQLASLEAFNVELALTTEKQNTVAKTATTTIMEMSAVELDQFIRVLEEATSQVEELST